MNPVNEISLTERFVRYVQIDTQSDPQSTSFPTTEKQKKLSELLCNELVLLGVAAETDEFGYVYGSIAGNSEKDVPAICFCSHVDTAPDCSGTYVKPILHRNYDGSDLVLPDDENIILKKADYPYLKHHIGSNIITASGTTLLGADDKSGVAIIMEMVAYLTSNPEIKHGPIKIVFTPDEEVGKGTARIDMKKVGAVYGYTLDGGEAGSLEDETFSADGATIVINGISAHPGYAKDKLINAIKIAGELLTNLPREEWSPESTEGKTGFVHPVAIEGIAEKATITFIVRDFDTRKLAEHHERLRSIAKKTIKNYPGTSFEYSYSEQYRNMKEMLIKHPQVTEYAAEAIRRSGMEVKNESIRGGTDGSRLSFMGLPCANLFAGMQAIHSKLEWIGVNDMIKSVETLLNLVQIWEEKT